eukprot:gene10896-14626_t
MPSNFQKNLNQRKYEGHMKRIREMKSSVDDKKPRGMPMNDRKETERRVFQKKIEEENRLILDRLGKAMSIKNIDNQIDHRLVGFPSLLESEKKRFSKRIVDDNRRLLKRIQITEPVYKVEEWRRENEKHVEHLRNMTEFPEYFVPPRPPSSRPVTNTNRSNNNTRSLADNKFSERSSTNRNNRIFLNSGMDSVTFNNSNNNNNVAIHLENHQHNIVYYLPTSPDVTNTSNANSNINSDSQSVNSTHFSAYLK